MSSTYVLFFVSFLIHVHSHSIVIEVTGDCRTVGHQIAQKHGYRFVREIFEKYCEIEEDPSSVNYGRHRRAIEQGIDPANLLARERQIRWAESQTPKIRNKRELLMNDPEWNNMWYLMRRLKNPALPDLNVTGAWALGYTGRGHVVTFLDDGLEFDHPDLSENYDKEASTDINGNDDDPSPRYEATNENKHGTRCAGEVAAKANNGVCGVGIAYHARVGGIRMLDGDVTDSVEARSLSHRPDHVEIYSASWGPDDNGLVVDGPGPLAKKAFENGIANGRGGKGSIFVWASGNGGRSFDSCACDGYITSIYTIAVSSVTESGNKPWYLEECSATLTSAYSSGQGGGQDHEIITTDLHHECTSHHSGTSAAAPLAAAIYALVLEANTNLTWRDVMHITVLGSRPSAIPSNRDFIQNAAGFNVSSKFGFGLMDAGLMTWYASRWKNVQPMSTCRSEVIRPSKKIDASSSESVSIDFTSQCQNSGAPNSEVNYIEQVQVTINLEAQRRGDMEIYLYSPSKTRTQLLPKRANDNSEKGFQNWSFLSVQLWGEQPHGQWRLEVVNTGKGSTTLVSYQLIVHGTMDDPRATQSLFSNSNQSSCHIECKSDEPCGNTDTSCTTCRHYKQAWTNGTFRCIGICPDGSYSSGNEKICLPCHSQCGSCRNASEFSCVNCKEGFYLLTDRMQCVDTCPSGFYTDRRLRKCIRCKAGCAACQDRPDVCSLCPADYAIKDTDCVKAVKQCGTSEYYDFTMDLCRWCDSRCATCSGPQMSQCRSCDPKGKYLYLQSSTCVSSCSTGFYLDSNISQCLPCHETCSSCTSSNENSCLSCKLGYVYLPDTHRCEKNTGKPFYSDPKTGESRPCHISCAQCKGPKGTDCIACNPVNEVLLDDGHCVNECPHGFYVNVTTIGLIDTNVCVSCPIGCVKCHQANHCEQCDESRGYRPKDFQCFPTCAVGSYLSGTQCLPCQSPCATCSDRTHCFSCVKDFVLYKDQCLSQCPNGSYSQKSQCLDCNPLCGNCQGPSEDDCLSCTNGFTYDAKEMECVNKCPNGNYFNNDDQVCHLCTDDCLECLQPGSYCRQCSYPMSLDSEKHRCLPCCSSNVTTADCCQCPSVWDGICLHRLLNPSSQSWTWWLTNPLDKIREQFVELDRPHQTLVLVLSLVVMLILALLLVGISISYFYPQWFVFKSKETHNNVEYIMLTGQDEDEF